MKTYIITVKLRKNDDSPLAYVTNLEKIELDKSDKNKNICRYMPTISWFKKSALKFGEEQAKCYFNELKKNPDLYFDLEEVKDDKD